jgi:hypothetical protein
VISSQIKRLYQSVVILAVAGLFIFLSTANVFVINTSDFSIYNSGWNGCSTLALKSYQAGVFQPTFRYNHTSYIPVQQSFEDFSLNADVSCLFIIGPQTMFSDSEIDYVDDFISKGGMLFLADDFGSANSLLQGLNTSSRFSNKLLLDLSFEKNASFVAVSNFSDQSRFSFTDIDFLLLNYPSSLIISKNATVVFSSSPLSWLDSNGNGKRDSSEPVGPFPVLSVESYGEGEIVLLSDPSLLINGMAGFADNKRFQTQLFDLVLVGRSTVVFDESHRDFLIPFQISYLFTSQLSVGYKIAILLLVVFIFMFLFTSLPKKIYALLYERFHKKSIDEHSYSDDELVDMICKKHPSWNKNKVKFIVQRLNSNG